MWNTRNPAFNTQQLQCVLPSVKHRRRSRTRDLGARMFSTSKVEVIFLVVLARYAFKINVPAELPEIWRLASDLFPKSIWFWKLPTPHPVATVTAFEVNYNSIRKVLFLTSCFDQRQTRANKRTNKVCHNQSEKFYFLFFCEGENPPSVRRPLQALLVVAAGPGEW